MATLIIDAVARRNTDQDTIELLLSYEGQQVAMTAPVGATLEELAALILAQEFPPAPPQAFQKRIIIEAHQENGTLILPGAPWVVDSVTVEQLPNERARDEFEGFPGWATWTGAEAADWIEDNVTDLESAKTALTAMARAIVALRDWR